MQVSDATSRARLHSAAGRRALIQSALALVAFAVLAAGASAATISPDRACYVNARQHAMATIVGSGFTPGDDIEVSGFAFAGHATADANGQIAVRSTVPTPFSSGPVTSSFGLEAQDETAGTGFVAATWSPGCASARRPTSRAPSPAS